MQVCVTPSTETQSAGRETFSNVRSVNLPVNRQTCACEPYIAFDTRLRSTAKRHCLPPPQRRKSSACLARRDGALHGWRMSLQSAPLKSKSELKRWPQRRVVNFEFAEEKMKPWIAAYGAALVVIGILDAIWLGWVMRDFYREALGSAMVESVRKLPALLFYLGYPLGVLPLVLKPLPATAADAALKGVLVGVLAYATYDLSNLATLKIWTWQLALIDIAWGAFITATAAAAAYQAHRRFSW